MTASSTIIAALKFEGGVVIGADSQASDIVENVRWPIEKLDQVRTHPLVLGFSGDDGSAKRARVAVEALSLSANTFRRRDRVRNAIEGALAPEYDRIKVRNPNPPTSSLWTITIDALAVFWAEDAPHIIQFEFNGDCCFHDYFHAIGSGKGTAYAIHRTLGGNQLARLDGAKSTMALLRILRTCVSVEMRGVSEPLHVWRIEGGRLDKLSPDEVQTNLQYVDEWEVQDRKRFLES